MDSSEISCIFRAKGDHDDTENARLAVDGLDGEIVRIVLKKCRKKMFLVEIVKYARDNPVFGIKDPSKNQTEPVRYEGVAEIWY